jgi:hypothetical protein
VAPVAKRKTSRPNELSESVESYLLVVETVISMATRINACGSAGKRS